MVNAAARLAAHPSKAWKANALSTASATAAKKRTASAVNSTARPASPSVIYFLAIAGSLIIGRFPSRTSDSQEPHASTWRFDRNQIRTCSKRKDQAAGLPDTLLSSSSVIALGQYAAG